MTAVRIGIGGPVGSGKTALVNVLCRRLAAALRPLKQDVVGSIGNVLWILMGTIGIVMLIVCANVGNLLLVLGLSFFVGGLGRKSQTFHRTAKKSEIQTCGASDHGPFKHRMV